MSYRYGNREQMGLFPQSIEDYVKSDDPVRAYDAIVESLDFLELGIELGSDKVGCPQYDPKAMLKLLVYGYSYGIRSSRKLERATYHNVSFIWLTGGLKPDHKTIAEFRRKDKKALKKEKSIRCRNSYCFGNFDFSYWISDLQEEKICSFFPLCLRHFSFIFLYLSIYS